jgi:mannose-6-phosphate isomerase class I
VMDLQSQGIITHQQNSGSTATSLTKCPYFHLEMLSMPQERNLLGESFHTLTVISGEARVSTQQNEVVLRKFETVLVSAVCRSYHLDSNF